MNITLYTSIYQDLVYNMCRYNTTPRKSLYAIYPLIRVRAFPPKPTMLTIHQVLLNRHTCNPRGSFHTTAWSPEGSGSPEEDIRRSGTKAMARKTAKRDGRASSGSVQNATNLRLLNSVIEKESSQVTQVFVKRTCCWTRLVGYQSDDNNGGSGAMTK